MTRLWETRGGPDDRTPGDSARHWSCRIFASAAMMGLALWAQTAGAQSTSPRAAAHDTFGRMAFDWNGPVQWSADVVNNQLVLRFDKPVAGDPHVLLKPLSHYLKSVTESPDRRMLSFPLAVPVQIKAFTAGESTVVDLTEAPAATESVAKTGAQALPPAAPAHGPAAPSGEPAVDLIVRGGEHPGFTRVVFDWPKPVTYAVTEDGSRATISFDQAARVNTTALAASLPTDVTVAEARTTGKTTTVVLALPNGMRVRHFTSGARVVVDLVRPADAEPPPRPAGAPPPPLAPAPGTEAQPKALQPLQSSPPPSLPTSSLPAPTPPPEAAPAPAPASSVGVSFDQPAAAAAFPRAGWLWLVFDRPAAIDPKALVRTGAGIVLDAQPVPVKGGTAVRLLVKPGYQPVPRRDGKMWVFDLLAQPLTPKVALELSKQFDFADKGRLLIKGGQPSKPPLTVRDPEVGDTLWVAPTTTVGAGVTAGLSLPFFDLLPTTQGVALVAKADGVRLDVVEGTAQAAMPGGIPMSADQPSSPTADAGKPATAGEGSAGTPTAAGAPSPMAASSGRRLDIARWGKGGLDEFEDTHQQLLQDLAEAPSPNRGPLRLALARHYLANAMGAEALGVLKDAVMADPSLDGNPDVRAVRGAANLLMHRNGAAIADLSHPSLAGDRDAAVWLAVAKADAGEPPAPLAPALRSLPEAMAGWPIRLKVDMARIAVPALCAADAATDASRIVNALNDPELPLRDQGTIDYLAGLAAETAKDVNTAVKRYQKAEEGWSQPDRAFAARNRIELQLRQGQIKPAEAIHQMERLRFAWRGGDFEYRVLKRLGEMQLADGRYGEALRTMRSLIQNFPDNPDTPNVAKAMQEAFNRLFLGGEADKMKPVVAIGLFDEFQLELTPQGEQGDEMIRKLADRLAAVDLNTRAAELLKHQVQFRLSGVEKAKVGARLAFIELTDHQPKDALEALDGSEVPDQPPELYDQRRYMRVRALADLGRAAEALALIINDDSPTARKLRAEIYWDMKKWPEAAAALQALLPEPTPGHKPDDITARRVLDTATALTLAKDEHGLQKLRRDWGAGMAQGQLKEAFDLLTAPPDQGIPDYRRIPDKIKQVQDFGTFMSEWSSRVKAKGLSSIN